MTGRAHRTPQAALSLPAVLLFLLACPLAAQDAEPGATSQMRRISVTFTEQPIGTVLQAFASYSGTSIVQGSGVSGVVTADINDQPWDVALRAILNGMGLVAVEDEYGIIRVSDVARLNDQEQIEPVVTRAYRINYSRAAEIQAAIAPILSERGSATVAASQNTLVVSDIARVQGVIADLLR